MTLQSSWLNHRTEEDVRKGGLEWAIGRNGIYVEPDVEYIENYIRQGEIANCAGDGKCGYTTRGELADAYARMLIESEHNGCTYNLHGDAITQRQLAAFLSEAFDTRLNYREMSVADYRAERVAELGEFLGAVIAGIYEGIQQGANDRPSDFATAVGRQHIGWNEYFKTLRSSPRR